MKIEALSKEHMRVDFDCGNEALNHYLKTQASQDMRKTVATIIAAIDPEGCVAGFYTLCTSGLHRADIPMSVGKHLPMYKMLPAILLGRLAVDKRYQGAGLGYRLLAHAFKRCATLDVAWSFLVADAKNEKARLFYQHLGFTSLLDEENHMCIPKRTVLEITVQKMR